MNLSMGLRGMAVEEITSVGNTANSLRLRTLLSFSVAPGAPPTDGSRTSPYGSYLQAIIRRIIPMVQHVIITMDNEYGYSTPAPFTLSLFRCIIILYRQSLYPGVSHQTLHPNAPLVCSSALLRLLSIWRSPHNILPHASADNVSNHAPALPMPTPQLSAAAPAVYARQEAGTLLRQIAPARRYP